MLTYFRDCCGWHLFFMTFSLNKLWRAAVVQPSLILPTSLYSSPVSRPDSQQSGCLWSDLAVCCSLWSANISERFRQGWMHIIHIHFLLENEKTRKFPTSICFLVSAQMHTSKLPVTVDYIFKLTPMAAMFHLQGPFWNDPISTCSLPLFPSDNGLFPPVGASVELIRSSSVRDSHTTTTTILNTVTRR